MTVRLLLRDLDLLFVFSSTLSTGFTSTCGTSLSDLCECESSFAEVFSKRFSLMEMVKVESSPSLDFKLSGSFVDIFMFMSAGSSKSLDLSTGLSANLIGEAGLISAEFGTSTSEELFSFSSFFATSSPEWDGLDGSRDRDLEEDMEVLTFEWGSLTPVLDTLLLERDLSLFGDT